MTIRMNSQKQDQNIQNEPIAIIGMGCVFPDADNPKQYWDNIINKHSAIGEIPKDRWDAELYFHTEKDKSFHSYSKLCAAVKDFKKDPLKFRIPPVSAPFIERIQFFMLEAAYQALEDAGYLKKDFAKQQTAVFIGTNGKGEMGPLYNAQAHWVKFVEALKSTQGFQGLPNELKQTMLIEAEKYFKQDMPDLSEDTCAGIFGSIFASRINHCFNLGGTSLVVDAACASSLAAVNLAVKGLRDSQFDLVFAGGVDGCLDISSYIYFSSLGAISAKGSFPFDSRADGFILGEGAGMILLKRLSDAKRDGDKIYALIRDVGTSSDGRAKGITAPDIKGQVLALERTYTQASLSPDTISLIEAHGTGTWIGDEIELASLNKFFKKYSARKKSIGLGSVKSMIGHLKSASGMAGIIKVVQAMHNKILPPTINCESPRKDFDWDSSPFYLITDAKSWDSDCCPRRAAVDSFGFGGINYHAILEEAPSNEQYENIMINAQSKKKHLPSEIFIFRATTRNEVLKQILAIKHQVSIECFSALKEINVRNLNSAGGVILTIVAADKSQLSGLLEKASTVLANDLSPEFFSMQGVYYSETPLTKKEKIAFLFPGSGAQYLNMGGDLAQYFSFAGNVFSQVDKISYQHTGLSMLPLLMTNNNYLPMGSAEDEKLLIRSDYNHPAIMALEAGIFEILLRCGIKPDMVAGHSLGEYFALYAAGVFDLRSIINITTIRGGGIVKHCFENGAMASINLSAKQVEEIIKDASGFVRIANKNCPAQTVISGDVKAVQCIINTLTEKGVMCKLLSVKSAYHTDLLSPSVEPFKEFLKTFYPKSPTIPIQSNLTGACYRVDKDFSNTLPDILAEHMVRPVEFIKNISTMYEDGARLFIEVGPRSALSSFVDNILQDQPHWTAQTNIPTRSATLQMLHCLALCIAKGVAVDLSRINSNLKLQNGYSSDSSIDKKSKLIQTQEDSKPVDFELRNKLVALIADKTGYPADVIDIDLDVESELGLDSIKQVEIIKTAAKILDIDLGTDIRSQRYKITTPRKLINLCRDLLDRKSDDKKKKQVFTVQTIGPILSDQWSTNCHRWVSKKSAAPLSKTCSKDPIRAKNVIILAVDNKKACLLEKYLMKNQTKVSIYMLDQKPQEMPDECDIVLDLSSFNEDNGLIPQSDQWWGDIRKRTESILVVTKGFAKQLQRNKNKQVVWVEVTSLGGQLNGSETSTISSRAGIGLGIMRCLVQEFSSRLIGLCLDFDTKMSDKQVFQAVCNELHYGITYPEIGYIKKKRFEIRWIEQEVKSKQGNLELNSQSVILAIGGSRGITASICNELARDVQPKMIIIGKSEVDLQASNSIIAPLHFKQQRQLLLADSKKQHKKIVPAEIDRLAWQQVWNSERLWNMQCLAKKTNAIYYQCDITDQESINCLINKIKRQYGGIDLVINGASGLIEKSTEDITITEFIDNMKAKALGTMNLISSLSDIPINAFVNFSSVAGRWGNKGQSSYAAGHEIAASLVSAMRMKNDKQWINIFFGPWLNVGMIRVGDVVNRLKQKGSDFITQQTGNEFFIKELTGQLNQDVAFCGTKSIRTQAGDKDQVCVLFAEQEEASNTARLLGYKHGISIIQVSIPYLRESLKKNEDQFIKENLHKMESQRYFGFKYEKKRLEWLAGRLAAKEALSRYFLNDNFKNTSISIYNQADGCPKIRMDTKDVNQSVPHVSISHSRDIAVALIGQDAGIAIDVQEVKQEIKEIADDFSDKKEQQMFQSIQGLTQDQVLTTIWAVKESARKAVGVELCTMKALKIQAINIDGNNIICDLYHANTGKIRSGAIKSNNYIMAIGVS